MRDINFGNDCYYHIYNRGVDRRTLFLDDEDFSRFYQSMYLFNDQGYRHDAQPLYNETLLAAQSGLPDERQKFVEIVAFCLMSNHYHIFLRQQRENGVAEFMHKLSMGYAKYFNRKYDRTGSLFEGGYKAIHVDRDAHFAHLPRYIHLNALDGSTFDWRNGRVQDWFGALQFLDNYRWSSHTLYRNHEQELPVVEQAIARELFPTSDMYLYDLELWTGREVPASIKSLGDFIQSPSDFA